MPAIASPTIGSSHHQPSAALAMMLVRVPAAISAQSRDWAASLAVAEESSRLATSSFAFASSGHDDQRGCRDRHPLRGRSTIARRELEVAFDEDAFDLAQHRARISSSRHCRNVAAEAGRIGVTFGRGDQVLGARCELLVTLRGPSVARRIAP